VKFSEEKKKTIVMYLLEKIEAKTEGLSRYASEALGISPNTVHTYLQELLQAGIIEREKRDVYRLVAKEDRYTFLRSRGDLDSDTFAYDVCLRDKLADMGENVKHIWSYAFSEMTNNVMDHSEAERLEVYVKQTYFSTFVALADNGVGIFEKIRSHFSLPGLEDAICELFKGKLTTDAVNHSGEGIFFTSKMMDTFFILSDGKIFATTKYEEDLITDAEQGAKGTCVMMSLSNFTQKSAAEIFNAYADEEGTFVKTRLTLKNIFETARVSRSQAKRLCSGLDRFSEAVLDFSDISWMGQGFAHQLFVLYKKEHPGVKLIPVNMNEDVMGMYMHVMGAG
jgi:Mn-dependent DtxR family transcriptional regulator